MIDTVGISIPNNGNMDFTKLRDTGNYKVIRNHKKRIDTSVNYYTYRNFLIEKPINASDFRDIKIYGSLQKIVNKQNTTPNSIQEIVKELNDFSDMIKIDLLRQKVIRVDVCDDYQVELVKNVLENIYPVENYHKKEYNTSLYFDKWKSKKHYTSCFYDKGQETNQPGKNILRQELRLYKAILNKNGIYTLNDVLNHLDDLETIRKDNMKDFKVTERKPIDYTGTKRDLILRAREVGVVEIMKQIKDEYRRNLISRRTYFNRKKIINDNINLIENQSFETLKSE
jgi:hypothetical protein